MAIDQDRKRRAAPLTSEEMERVQAIRAKHRTPEAQAEEARARELLNQEYRETGTIETTGDGTTMGDMVAFRRFIMSLRQEREHLGFSLNEMAERAKIDKAALSRLENGQQLNPTVNTLARYVHALGKSIAWSLSERCNQSDEKPSAAGNG
jgi:ribosome-binding protein aMBF1 (putative translation factor)